MRKFLVTAAVIVGLLFGFGTDASAEDIILSCASGVHVTAEPVYMDDGHVSILYDPKIVAAECSMATVYELAIPGAPLFRDSKAMKEFTVFMRKYGERMREQAAKSAN